VKKVIGTILVIIMLAATFAAYAYQAPLLTLKNIAQAIEDGGDPQVLQENIDFNKLRNNIKEQIRAQVAIEAAKDQAMKNNPFALMGAALADKMIDSLIDAYVNPYIFKTKKINRDRARELEEKLSDATIEKISPESAIVSVKLDNDAIKIVMEREGLRYKITNIVIPKNSMKELGDQRIKALK